MKNYNENNQFVCILEKVNHSERSIDKIYKFLVDNSSDPIYCCDITGKYLYANYAFSSSLNKQPMDIVGKEIIDFFSGNESKIRLNVIKYVFETGKTKDVEVKVQNEVSLIYFITTVKPLKDTFGNVEMVMCISKDITERKLAEEALKESERFLLKSQKMAHIGSFVMDLKTKTWKGSPELYNIAGIDQTYPHTAKGWNKIIHPDYRRKVSDYFFKVEAENLYYDYEYKIIRVNDGEELWVHGLGDFEFDNQGNAISLIATVQDITKRKKAEEEVIYLSYNDKLTGLYNRRFYEEEVKRLDTERNLPISIIIGDVNGLKLVNDAFGHVKGDELLQKAAAAIQSACRADDIVARWGGDEFVILLPKTKSEEVEGIINRIKQQYSNQQVNALSISISFGWDSKKKIDEDILQVLKSAEDYMYKHKIIENESVRSNIISTIIKTLHEKNPREEQHSERVSEICQSIGKAMGFSEIERSKLKVVGLLHDIGKIAIEEGILNKPGKLTEGECNEIKRHPEIGYRILTTSYDMLEFANCISAHHERWDGAGYPSRLKGEAIPRIARIIALADSYDAMTSERPYRNRLSEEEALLEIRKNSGTQFDPEIARIFIEKVLDKHWS